MYKQKPQMSWPGLDPHALSSWCRLGLSWSLFLHFKLNTIKLRVVLHNSRGVVQAASDASNLYSSCGFLSIVQFQVSKLICENTDGSSKRVCEL